MKKGFTLAEILMPKRTSGIKNEVLYSRESEGQAPSNKIRKLAAFTLAEVLIVLAIISVVAVLTVANLIKSYQKHVTIAKLKEAYSVLSQTFQASELQNGSVASWDVIGYIQKRVDSPNRKVIIDEVASTYIVPYMKAVESGRKNLEVFGYKNGILRPDQTAIGSPGNDVYGVLLQNGMFVVFGYSEFIPDDETSDQRVTLGLVIFVDLDGPTHGPNTLGKDVFEFQKFFSNDLQLSKLTMFGIYETDVYHLREKTFSYRFNTRDEIMERCKDKNEGQTCGALIMKDGWQIKDDYPWL